MVFALVSIWKALFMLVGFIWQGGPKLTDPLQGLIESYSSFDR